jgi:GNAT superfamily N-acetyltransferase
MTIELKEVKSDADIKTFVNFQFAVYKGSKFWVPPIKKDEIKALSPKTNPAYKFCDAAFWLAYKDGKCVGRIGAIVNHAYNKKTDKLYGRINRIEFIDDKEVFDSLINKAEEWLNSKGMTFIHGPLGFSNLDTQGLQIEGFDHLPSIASVYHHEYYQHHFDRCHYEKENDWVEFRLKLNEKAVTKGSRGAEIVKRRFGFELVDVKTKKEMKKYAHRIFQILNEAFVDLPYVSEFNDEMIELYAKKYFDILDPYFITLVKKEDELIGFFIGLPNLSEAMQKASGSLFPFGFIHVLRALKKPKVIDMMLTGVLPEHQSSGVAVILVGELQRRMLERGIDQLETTGVFETNQNVISNWKNYDHNQYKRRRCYVKELK